MYECVLFVCMYECVYVCMYVGVVCVCACVRNAMCRSLYLTCKFTLSK
jgi:hypothetical protein